MTTEEKIEVMQAWVDHRKIEVRKLGQEESDEWHPATASLIWDWLHYDYRIAPAPPPLPVHPPLPAGKRYVPKGERHGPAPKGLMCEFRGAWDLVNILTWQREHYCADIDQDEYPDIEPNEWKVCPDCGNTLADQSMVADHMRKCEGKEDEVERCEVDVYDLERWCYVRDNTCCILYEATSDEDFIAYEYEEGLLSASPRLCRETTLPAKRVARKPVAVLFRRSK